MLQYLDAELETKTGVTKQAQGIDADALQNQSATAVAQVFSASQLRMKLIARIMAEGVRDIFSLLHHTIRSHGQEQQTVRLRNQWVPVDPRNWKTRNDMTINVGLGTGGKAQQFAQIMALANVQKEIIAGGKGNLVGDRELYNTAAEITKIMGHKNPNQFFNDPEETNPDGSLKHPPLPPPVDPKIEALRLKAQTDQMAAKDKAAIEKLQAEADIATQDRKTAAEIALAEKKAELEAQLKMLDSAMKKEEHDQKMTLAREQHHMTVQQGRLGMAATAQAHDAKIEQMKAKPEKGAKASIDIKQGGEEVKALSDKVDAQTKALLEMGKQMSRPKKIIRDKAGKAQGVE